MPLYDRQAVKRSPYARHVPACMCADSAPLELIVQTFVNDTIHYRLGCAVCGKLGLGFLPHAKVSAASKATAKPYRSA